MVSSSVLPKPVHEHQHRLAQPVQQGLRGTPVASCAAYMEHDIAVFTRDRQGLINRLGFCPVARHQTENALSPGRRRIG
jgi:hypothetical protein